jgi:hypothetical protein
MRILHTAGTLVTALALGAGATACGEEAAPSDTPRSASAKVELTMSLPGGGAPLALITYQGDGGRTCHALGTLTTRGPRVLDALDQPLETGLGRSGHCLGGHGVSLATARVGGGELRVLGGLAAKGVRRVVVGGERVRPSRSGAFLVAQRSPGSLSGDVELIYAGGGHERVPLASLAGVDARH